MPSVASISKPFFFWLLTALLWQGRTVDSRACQYCRLAAMDPEAARMAAQTHSGGFPLEAAINQFQGTAPAAVLTAPPAAGSVAMSAADLPSAARLAGVPAVAPPVVTKAAGPKQAAIATRAAPLEWADAGLLGLCAAGGLFYWRTRRVPAPVG